MKKQQIKKVTLRKIKSILRTEKMLDAVEVNGRSYDWEIEAPTQQIGNKIRKILRTNGIPTGGYTTGFDGEIIRAGGSEVDLGDWNDTSSRWHY